MKEQLKWLLSYNATKDLTNFREYFTSMVCKMMHKFIYVLETSIYENNIDDDDDTQTCPKDSNDTNFIAAHLK